MSSNRSLEHIFRQIVDDLPMDGSSTIIGINGYDASGKTEFTKNFNFWLEENGYLSHIIHLDDFHNPLKVRRTGETENQAYIDNAFDLERVVTLLRPIQEGQSIDKTLTLLDLETDTYRIEKSYRVNPGSIILLEGVLLFRPPINQYLNYRIYLDVDPEVCLQRNIKRSPERSPEEVTHRYRRKYLQINNWYYRTFAPNKQANMVIDNNDYTSPRVLS